MPRGLLLRLMDIQEAIAGIQDLANGVSYDAFAQTWATQRAVERGLEIISEATRHIPPEYRRLEPETPGIRLPP